MGSSGSLPPSTLGNVGDASRRSAAARLCAAGIPTALALVTALIFAPAIHNGFVEWDDDLYLLANPNYRGLGWTHLRWMFTTVRSGHWIPLTWMTFGLDYVLWGMNAAGYHGTNVLLHAANAAVFYLVARRLLRAAMPGIGETSLRSGAVAAALFFAAHPLRAESVAWVSERKDVLSGLFCLLSVLAYLIACDADSRKPRSWLAASLGCYALALASKSIVMTLPLVLIILDIYPLRRLGGTWREWSGREARRVWAEKTGYLVLGTAGGLVALYAVRASLTPLETLSAAARVAVGFHSFWFYVWTTLVPLDLSPLYELPQRVNPLELHFVAGVAAVSGLTAGFILARRRWPAGLAVWASYAIILAPVSGILHAGYQLTHDRYSYLACLGWALLVGAAVCALARARDARWLRPVLARGATWAVAIWIVVLSVLTWNQVQVWRDGRTLWLRAIDADPDCFTCRVNLGVALYNQGQPARAAVEFRTALGLRPDAAGLDGRLGLALIKAGQLSQAAGHLRRALEGDPKNVEILTSLGIVLFGEGRSREAVGYLRRATEVRPDSALPRFWLVRADLALGDVDSARAEYEILKKLAPDMARQLAPSIIR